MSSYTFWPTECLVDASNKVVGVLGPDGRQWSFPDALTSGSDVGDRVHLAFVMLYDSTNAPVGFLVDGKEWLFSSAFTANTNPMVRVRHRSLLLDATTRQPVGVRSDGGALLFPNPPTLPGTGTPGLPARPWNVAGQMQMGMNTGPSTNFSGRHFANIVFDMGPWSPVNADGTARTPGAWSQSQGALVGDGDGSGTDAKYFRATICASIASLPGGTYTVFNPSGQEFAIGAFSSLYITSWTTAKYFTFTYTPSGSGIFLWCRRSMAAGGAGNLQIILPGAVGDGAVDTVNGMYGSNGTHGVSGGNPWNPDFLTFASGLGLQRYRWMPALRVIGSCEQDWTDRVLPTGISFYSKLAQGNVIPHELIVDFSNRTGIDPWINMPPVSTPTYWATCAALYKAGLNTNRKICPAYANETWNFALSAETASYVAYLAYTMTTAPVSDISDPQHPVFNSPAHGRSPGDQIILFATRENAPIGSTLNFWMQGGFAYNITSVPDADHFTLTMVQHTVNSVPYYIPPGLVNIKYAYTGEAGKSSTSPQPDRNHSTQQLAIWDAFDAVFGTSRVIHANESQAANATVTTNRMAYGAMASRCDHVPVAPYYSGLHWGVQFNGGGSKITPSLWASVAGKIWWGVYASGSIPSMLDVARQTGTGFIGGATQSISSQTVTNLTAVTGLTDGTNYAAFVVFQETTTGYLWMIGTGTDALNPSNVLSTTGQVGTCYDSFVNQAARSRLDQVVQSNEVAQNAAIASAGSPATLISYEGGPDFNKNNCPSYLTTWLVQNHFPSTAHASTFTHTANHLARVGYRGYNHYIDIQGGANTSVMLGEFVYDLVPNNLFSATAVDGRYAALAAFSGTVTAQAPIPSSVSLAKVAAPITAAPGAFPYTVYSGLPSGYTYSIVSGDWTKNFAVSGNSIVMNNATGVSFAGYSPTTLVIEANDGYSSVSFKLSIPIGSAWYESDAAFVWDSVAAAAATTMTPPSNPPFASFGAALSEVAGTGNPPITSSSGTVTNDVWKMATYVFGDTTAMAAGLPFYDVGGNPIALLIAHLVDIGDQATTASAYEVGISQGTNFIGFGTPLSASSTLWKFFLNGASLGAFSDGTCPAKGTKAVHWAFVDPANNQIVCGINQTVGTTNTVTVPNTTTSRDVRIGSYNGSSASESQMYHGSLEIVSRAGLTLTQAKAIVQNMQTHHGI